jgi:DNA-binding MarR family transcriptional regulator
MQPTSGDLSITELTAVIGAFTRMNIRLPSIQRHSFTTLSVLHSLAHDGPKRLTELAASEQVTQPAITQIVTKLEKEGLVERHPDPSDGRAVLVHITPKGAEIPHGRESERITILTDLATLLTPAERAAISAALPALTRLVELNTERTSNT